jgi:hypothetical protein
MKKAPFTNLTSAAVERAALPPVRPDPLLIEAASVVQHLQDQLEECMMSYAMPSQAQAHIMRLLREATLFRRKVHDLITREAPKETP